MKPEALLRGRANDARETFEFTVERFVAGGFLLSIHFNGDGRENITGAGVWPTLEKAKQIAAETAERLLHGAEVIWDQDPRPESPSSPLIVK